MTKDMTSGSPTKLILFFSIPMLFGNLFQQFYNMVDAMVVGRFVGVGALAAVGATGSMLFTIIGFAMGLTTGFSIVISQRFGAKNESGMRQAIAMSAVLSAIISVIMTVAGILLSKPLLILMRTPADILDDAAIYLQIIFAGVTAGIFYNLVSSILRAVGDSKTPLIFLVIASLLNVGLDLLFVISFNMGVAGVAVATIIAQGFSCVLCVIYMYKKHELLRLKRSDWRWDKSTVHDLMRMGIPSAFQTSITGIGVLILQVVVNGFGSTVVAAYTAACKVQQLSTQILGSFSMAIATYVGQNFGAGRLDRVKKGVRSCLVLMIISSLLGFAIVFVFGGALTQFFVSGAHTDVIEYSRRYLNLAGVFYIALGVLALYRSAVQGLGNAIVPMVSGFLELLLRVAVALTLPSLIGYDSIALTDATAWIGAAVLVVIGYFREYKRAENRFGLTGKDCKSDENIGN